MVQWLDMSNQQPTDYQRFEALTRRILTTPKAQLVKGTEKKPTKAAKGKGKK
jgi:hypothetical protein